MLVMFLAGTVAGMLVCGGLGSVYVFWQMERARAAEGAALMAAMRDDRSTGGSRVIDDEKLRELWRNQLTDGPLSRGEFNQRVVGKTDVEVVSCVGKGDAIEERDDDVCWVYVGRTINPETEKPDRKAVVRFRDGKVADVTFE